MVFQWGWAKDLIGLESTVPIISFIPLFMFAILFGLSMDYEVFLLSRIREEYLRTGDNDHAVVHGIGVTARTISAGAAIMVCVFGGFITGSDPTMKMLGLGLATAVLVDATVVRLVLVPGDHEAARRGQLVAARLAGPAAAVVRPRRRPGPRDPARAGVRGGVTSGRQSPGPGAWSRALVGAVPTLHQGKRESCHFPCRAHLGR